MRILFACRMLPHAKSRDSGRLDTYHYIAALSKKHTISLIAFVPPEDELGVAGMEKLCQEVVAVPYRRHNLGARLYRAWKRLVQPKVYGRNHSRHYVRSLKQLLSRCAFDVVVVDGMMAEYGRFLSPIPTVLDEVDLFFVVAHQLFRAECRFLPRLRDGFDWLRTTLRETTHLQEYAGVFVRSEKDAQLVRAFTPQQCVAVLSPWFEGLTQLMSIPIERRTPPPTLLFVGAMRIPANVTAVTYFAHRVFPLIQAQMPTARFVIVGSQPAPAVQALAANLNIIVTGDVPDLTPYYAEAAVIVTPLFTGGGIIVKTLNGLASGRPVVSTAIGNSGTGAENGRHLRIVSTNPQEMAAAILDLLTNKTEWQRLAQNGRQFIQTHYNWSQTIANMTQFLQTVSVTNAP